MWFFYLGFKNIVNFVLSERPKFGELWLLVIARGFQGRYKSIVVFMLTVYMDVGTVGDQGSNAWALSHRHSPVSGKRT